MLDDVDKKLDAISCMIKDNILPDEALRTVRFDSIIQLKCMLIILYKNE